jgi:hypothetical protein
MGEEIALSSFPQILKVVTPRDVRDTDKSLSARVHLAGPDLADLAECWSGCY